MAPSFPDGSMGPRMIFVVGARRSGTNWIGRIIGMHPDVAAVKSESYLFQTLAELTSRFQTGSMGSWQLATIYLERPVLIGALRSFCDTVFSSVLAATGGPASRLLERTPDHCRHLDLIGEIYPDARVVHIVRDGRDVARSLVAMRWPRGPTTLHDAAQEWVDSVRKARLDSGRLRHYVEVRYDELLADPFTGVTRLFGDLDLEVTPELVGAVLAEAEVKYNQDPGMPKVLARKWETALSPSERAEVEDVAGPLLEELGFAAPAAPGVAPAPAPDRALASRAVGAARRLAGTIRRWRGRGPARPGARTDARSAAAAQEAQLALDAFLGHVRAGRADEARAMIHGQASIRVVTGDQEWEGRGVDGARRLVEAMAADGAVTGAPTRSDVWPSFPAFTVVFAGVDDPALRTFVAYIRKGVVKQAAFYGPG